VGDGGVGCGRGASGAIRLRDVMRTCGGVRCVR
jgi:hypothetical protein